MHSSQTVWQSQHTCGYVDGIDEANAVAKAMVGDAISQLVHQGAPSDQGCGDANQFAAGANAGGC